MNEDAEIQAILRKVPVKYHNDIVKVSKLIAAKTTRNAILAMAANAYDKAE